MLVEPTLMTEIRMIQLKFRAYLMRLYQPNLYRIIREHSDGIKYHGNQHPESTTTSTSQDIPKSTTHVMRDEVKMWELECAEIESPGEDYGKIVYWARPIEDDV